MEQIISDHRCCHWKLVKAWRNTKDRVVRHANIARAKHYAYRACALYKYIHICGVIICFHKEKKSTCPQNRRNKNLLCKTKNSGLRKDREGGRDLGEGESKGGHADRPSTAAPTTSEMLVDRSWWCVGRRDGWMDGWIKQLLPLIDDRTHVLGKTVYNDARVACRTRGVYGWRCMALAWKESHASVRWIHPAPSFTYVTYAPLRSLRSPSSPAN